MPGFSKRDQARLALLVLGQRGKLQKLASMPAGDPNWRLVFCLRLAVLLHRARDDQPLPEISLRESAGGFRARRARGLAASQPDDRRRAGDETLLWRRIGIKVRTRRVAEEHAVQLELLQKS
jgi:exopolyphosphatase/guanosine-5'-triphosphate,3'-diphosphate pyrophosphatase